MTSELLQNIDAFLVSNPTNIRYLTGFVGAAPHEREAYYLATKDKMFLFTNSLYLESAQKLVRSSPFIVHSSEIKVIEISRDFPLSKRLKEILSAVGSDPKPYNLGFEEVDLTVAEFRKQEKELPQVELIPTQNLIEELRMIKRPDEIENIKKAAKMTDDCFEYILGKLVPGTSETEIAWEMETFFCKNNAASAFSPIVAFNEHSSQPHYSLTKSYMLDAKSSIILLDFGAKVNGYCADMTRVIFSGQPTTQQKNAYEILLNAQETALELLKKGERSGAKLDEITRNELTNNKLTPHPHSLGHGLGLDIHELPRLSYHKDEVLKPNMAFTIEPGVYLEGKFGIRIEDLVWINEKNEVEILSKSNKKLTIL